LICCYTNQNACQINSQGFLRFLITYIIFLFKFCLFYNQQFRIAYFLISLLQELRFVGRNSPSPEKQRDVSKRRQNPPLNNEGFCRGNTPGT
jgi:hypothetical protein